MITPYTELPAQAASPPRPLLDLVVEDMTDVLMPCLVDTGSVHTLLPRWLGHLAGLPLDDAESLPLAVAGSETEAALLTCRLSIAPYTWEAEVGLPIHGRSAGGFSGMNHSFGSSP